MSLYIFHTGWLRPVLLSTTLAVAIAGCEAKSNMQQIAQASEKTSSPSASVATSSQSNVFAGTYLFDARDAQSDFGKVHPQEAKRYDAAFKALLAEQVKNEGNFIQRITSGPSTRGEVLAIDGQSRVVHVACQAHRCDLERMGLYYTPASNRMVALLWSHCEETVIGSPSAADLSALRQIAKMSLPTAQDIARCKKESAAYE